MQLSYVWIRLQGALKPISLSFSRYCFNSKQWKMSLGSQVGERDDYTTASSSPSLLRVPICNGLDLDYPHRCVHQSPDSKLVVLLAVGTYVKEVGQRMLAMQSSILSLASPLFFASQLP